MYRLHVAKNNVTKNVKCVICSALEFSDVFIEIDSSCDSTTIACFMTIIY